MSKTNLRKIPTFENEIKRGEMPVTLFEFGDTAPLLRVAKKYGLEEHYGAVLHLAHFHSFNEILPGHVNSMLTLQSAIPETPDKTVRIGELVNDVSLCVERMRRLYAREEYAL